mmetsp:Transcript_13848/g.15319  ORF Transcript_13848/g.15319 Transcript_13848/m.15319 type:complete len:284 (-) Transcript_13848:58-909(-)
MESTLGFHTFSTLIMAPWARGKVILQTRKLNPQSAVGNFKRKMTIKQTLYHIIKQQGIISLFRGASIDISMYLPTVGCMNLYTKLFSRIFPPGDESALGILKKLLSKIGVGLCTMVTVYPLHLASTLYKVDFPQKNSFGLSLPQIYATDGLKGLYTGLSTKIYQMWIEKVLEFFLFDYFRSEFTSSSGFLKKFFILEFIFAIRDTIVYPMDTVRQRLIMQAGQSEKPFQSALECYHGILETEGVSFLFSGLKCHLVCSFVEECARILYHHVLNRAEHPRRRRA